MNEYQEYCLSVRQLKNDDDALIVSILGLTGEAGEVADCIKKNMTYTTKDGQPRYSNEDIAKELGDVLWYAAALAHDLGYTLEEVAAMNVQKLETRRKSNTLVSSEGR